MAVARTLHEARRQTAAKLARQVAKITADDGDDDRPQWIRVTDPQALRGLPAIGPHSASSAIHGTQPGFGLFDE